MATVVDLEAKRANGRRHPAKCEESEQTAADFRQSAKRASKRPQTSGEVRRESADGREQATGTGPNLRKSTGKAEEKEAGHGATAAKEVSTIAGTSHRDRAKPNEKLRKS